DPAHRPSSCQAFAEELQLGALSDRLEAKDRAERTVVMPPREPAAPPVAAGHPNSPFAGGPRAQPTPFPPASAPAFAPTARMRPRGVRLEMYPLLVVLVVIVVVVLGGVGVVWTLAERADDQGGPRTAGTTGAETGEFTETAEDPADTTAEAVSITRVDPTASSLTVHTDAEPGTVECALLLEATGDEVEGDCRELIVEGLHASTDYEFELRIHDSGQEPIVDRFSTETVLGDVFWDCPLSRRYCETTNAEIGVGADAERERIIGDAVAGDQFRLHCYAETDTEITPRGEEEEGYWDYHPGKDASNLAIQLDYDGEVGYVPFVWVIVEPGDLDSTGPLAEC
ncbi:hypothetical protein L0U85_13365, partial [Glycomyces sp. L485]